MAGVLSPKLQGAWALQQSVINLPLDFFINCSSIAGLWGGQRQAAYSAANAFLDGLAAFRRAQGQAALSINWGPLTASAMLSAAAAAELRACGVHSTPIEQATASLLPLLSGGEAQATVAAIDWTSFVPLYQSRCPTGLFKEVSRRAVGPVREFPPVPVESAARVDSPASLRAWLTNQLSAALHLPPHLLDADLPLPRLGLDSLIAVELRNRLLQQLGRAVSLPELFGELSLNGLVARLTAPVTISTAGLAETATQGEWITGEI
jgi:hypothetical protein